MTVKKAVLFLLTVVLALGGLGFAHAAVTAGQDDLLVYPTLQVGDPAVLEGLTASMTFTCGPHLRWDTEYPFGGEAKTAFSYSRTPAPESFSYDRNRMDIYLSQGYSTSVSGGGISLTGTAYSDLLQAVARETPQKGSKTMELDLSDYAEYYQPEYDLFYEDGSRECSEFASFTGQLTADPDFPLASGCQALMEQFRFPVREGHIVSVTMSKDGRGQITDLEFYCEIGPELEFISDVTAEGVWFVPIFRDETGAPLPYESPQGHGIYFIPWKTAGVIRYNNGTIELLTLDTARTKRVFPLEDGLNLQQIVIDAASGIARMLTLENGSYVLTTIDLQTAAVRTRLEVLPQAPSDLGTATFQPVKDHLLILGQGKLALTDAAGETLLLTAPDTADQRFGARFFDPDTGDLRFDGETLILTGTTWYREGTFWTAAWQQDQLLYYGEYDCSIMQGNDNWYYSYVTAEEHPIQLK